MEPAIPQNLGIAYDPFPSKDNEWHLLYTVPDPKDRKKAVSYWSEPNPWWAGEPFFVLLPEDANSATVFGKLKGKSISFIPSDPLNASDAANFIFMDKKVDPSLGTLFQFKPK